MTFCPCMGLRGFVTGKGGKHCLLNMPDKIRGCGRNRVLAVQMHRTCVWFVIFSQTIPPGMNMMSNWGSPGRQVL